MKYLMLGVIFLLAACGPQISTDGRQTTSGYQINEYKLSDGTQCVSVGSSVSCNWSPGVSKEEVQSLVDKAYSMGKQVARDDCRRVRDKEEQNAAK